MGRAHSVIAIRTSFRYISLNHHGHHHHYRHRNTTSNSYFVRRHRRNRRPYCSQVTRLYVYSSYITTKPYITKPDKNICVLVSRCYDQSHGYAHIYPQSTSLGNGELISSLSNTFRFDPENDRVSSETTVATTTKRIRPCISCYKRRRRQDGTKRIRGLVARATEHFTARVPDRNLCCKQYKMWAIIDDTARCCVLHTLPIYARACALQHAHEHQYNRQRDD